MRLGENGGWIFQNNAFKGVSFGSDFVAEHEWSIDELNKLLGVPFEDENLFGIERMKCRPAKDAVLLKEDGDTLNLIVASSFLIKNFSEKSMGDFRYPIPPGERLATFWCKNSCMIRSRDFEKVKELHGELFKGNVAVWLNVGDLVSNPSLYMVLADRISEPELERFRSRDVSAKELKEAAKATGIADKIDLANEQWRNMMEVERGERCCRGKWEYFSLKPRWRHKGDKGSNYKVVFWLNPENQDVNNFGWFTVEDLNNWLAGSGPVVKKGKKHGVGS